jgi:hypothetical protein
MNDDLKILIDNFLAKIKAGGHAEAVAQVQYFIQQIPHDTLVSMMRGMKKDKVVEIFSALSLSWKEANKISAAESQQIITAGMSIVLRLIALAFGDV